jgi:hypothetical protein
MLERVLTVLMPHTCICVTCRACAGWSRSRRRNLAPTALRSAIPTCCSPSCLLHGSVLWGKECSCWYSIQLHAPRPQQCNTVKHMHGCVHPSYLTCPTPQCHSQHAFIHQPTMACIQFSAWERALAMPLRIQEALSKVHGNAWVRVRACKHSMHFQLSYISPLRARQEMVHQRGVCMLCASNHSASRPAQVRVIYLAYKSPPAVAATVLCVLQGLACRAGGDLGALWQQDQE